jgi:hypothetical protein
MALKAFRYMLLGAKHKILTSANVHFSFGLLGAFRYFLLVNKCARLNKTGQVKKMTSSLTYSKIPDKPCLIIVILYIYI